MSNYPHNYKLKFIPEQVTEFDLSLFLVNHQYDILMHETEVIYIKELCNYIEQNNITGNVLECGVWKGGSAILIRQFLSKNWFVFSRKMYLADFYGVNTTFNHISMTPTELSTFKQAQSLQIIPPKIGDVITLLNKFNLFNQSIHFICGNVCSTLSKTIINSIAMLHIDVDFFEPTKAVLENTYSKVVSGGVVLINDYNVKNLSCKDAVVAYRSANNIQEPIIEIGKHMAYWIKK